MKCLPNLGINNKEKPLCFGYSVKARALLFAHLSRVPLPKLSLHQDRLYIVKKCPYLIHEMVSCISQLILLAHAGRIARLPSLDTVEATMKCSSLVVQVSLDLIRGAHVSSTFSKLTYLAGTVGQGFPTAPAAPRGGGHVEALLQQEEEHQVAGAACQDERRRPEAVAQGFG